MITYDDCGCVPTTSSCWGSGFSSYDQHVFCMHESAHGHAFAMHNYRRSDEECLYERNDVWSIHIPTPGWQWYLLASPHSFIVAIAGLPVVICNPTSFPPLSYPTPWPRPQCCIHLRHSKGEWSRNSSMTSEMLKPSEYAGTSTRFLSWIPWNRLPLQATPCRQPATASRIARMEHPAITVDMTASGTTTSPLLLPDSLLAWLPGTIETLSMSGHCSY